MRGVDICVSVKYNIKVPDVCAAEFWKTLTDNFNIILTKRQHSVNGEALYIEIKIIEMKSK